jgi:hypothetical protein
MYHVKYSKVIDDENKKCINAIRFFYSKRDWKNLLKEKSIEELMG